MGDSSCSRRVPSFEGTLWIARGAHHCHSTRKYLRHRGGRARHAHGESVMFCYISMLLHCSLTDNRFFLYSTPAVTEDRLAVCDGCRSWCLPYCGLVPSTHAALCLSYRHWWLPAWLLPRLRSLGKPGSKAGKQPAAKM